MAEPILETWNIKDLRKLVQAHATLGDRNGVFYLQPVNAGISIWLETRPDNGATAHTISVLRDTIDNLDNQTNLDAPLAFSTDLANLKTFLHDAESLLLQRDGDTLTWTKQTRNGTQVDYAVKCTQGTIPEMDQTFVIQQRTRTQIPQTQTPQTPQTQTPAITERPRREAIDTQTTAPQAEDRRWTKWGIALARAAGKIKPEQERQTYAALRLA